MMHLGDITKISGHNVPTVDVIIGGSPCQDLSVAGKRAGLAGERSGLYMEQIRIIKEMRDADVLRGRTGQFVRPRYMVWENVPGAFSSNKGKDFAAVIEEAIRVSDQQAPAVHVPDKGWPTSGCYYDVDGRWSVAWRVLDAQFWGVPQRRRRIALVADFGGITAPEILFERKGMSGDFEPCAAAREEATRPVEAGVGDSGAGSTTHGVTYCIQGNCIDRADTANCNGKGWKEGVSYTLNTIDRHAVFGFRSNAGSTAHGIGYEEEKAPTLSARQHDASVCIALESHPQDSRVKLSENNVVQTLSSKMGTGGGNVLLVMELLANGTDEMRSFREYVKGGVASTVKARDYKDSSDLVVTEIPQSATYQKVTGTLMANSHPGSYTGQDAYNDMLVMSVDCRSGTECPGVNGTLQAKANQSPDCNQVVRVHHIVRRLTPLECERLQGFPDNWTCLAPITAMTDAEYDFWKTVQFERAVRESRARKNEDGVFEIWKVTETQDENGDTVDVWESTHKPYKHKSKEQMVKWYNRTFVEAAESSRYKALGNSIAIPPWKWVLKRICACYERDATMASLFDGIGGFPHIWEQLNGKGSCLWASEIEEFPIAVTRQRFGGAV